MEPNEAGLDRVDDAELLSRSDVINGVVVAYAGRPVPEVEAALAAALSDIGAEMAPGELHDEAERISKLPAAPGEALVP